MNQGMRRCAALTISLCASGNCGKPRLTSIDDSLTGIAMRY